MVNASTFFRTMRGYDAEIPWYGAGFPETADVRLAQYENGSRTPKADVTAALAQALDVSPKALDVPDIDSYVGLMHTCSRWKTVTGLKSANARMRCICAFISTKDATQRSFTKCLPRGAKLPPLKAGEITKEEYDCWRYRYPELDTSGQWHKTTPS